MKALRIAAFCFCVLFSIVACAAATDDYAYAWPIRAAGNDPAWQVELTPEVYAVVATAGLRDVAVVNAAGEAVPSAAFRPPRATTRREDLVSPPAFVLPQSAGKASAGGDAIRLQFERGSDGRLRRVDADLGPGGAAHADRRRDLLLDASAIEAPLAALRLDWDDGPDVSAQFAVDASDDLQSWHAVVARATVLRLTQNGNRLDRHDIGLHRARAAYLRVRRLDDGPDLPGLDARVRTGEVSTAARPARQWLRAAAIGSDTRRLDASLGTTDGRQPVAWRYQLRAPLAIDAIRLELADDNSLARVRVLSRQRPGDDASAWMQRAAFVAFRLRQDDSVIGNDELAATRAPARTRDWRVESSTPLERAPTLSLAYEPDRFVFLAQGAGPFRLVAGSAAARRGDYPVDAALASLRASRGRDWQPPLATLGTRETLKGDAALVAPAVVKAFDWKSWLLWAVLVGAAAVIGGLALSLLRAARRGEKGEGRGEG